MLFNFLGLIFYINGSTQAVPVVYKYIDLYNNNQYAFLRIPIGLISVKVNTECFHEKLLNSTRLYNDTNIKTNNENKHLLLCLQEMKQD